MDGMDTPQRQAVGEVLGYTPAQADAFTVAEFEFLAKRLPEKAFLRCDHCNGLLAPCPACRQRICYGCEDWQRYHSIRGWLQRAWARIRARA